MVTGIGTYFIAEGCVPACRAIAREGDGGPSEIMQAEGQSWESLSLRPDSNNADATAFWGRTCSVTFAHEEMSNSSVWLVFHRLLVLSDLHLRHMGVEQG